MVEFQFIVSRSEHLPTKWLNGEAKTSSPGDHLRYNLGKIYSHAEIFPRLGPATCICFECWLVNWTGYLLHDWSEGCHRFWFYKTVPL